MRETPRARATRGPRRAQSRAQLNRVTDCDHRLQSQISPVRSIETARRRRPHRPSASTTSDLHLSLERSHQPRGGGEAAII